MIWNELKTRCHAAGLELGQESPEGARVRWVPVGINTMLITDWQNVLHTLEGAADGQEIRGDILQLRRLVERLEGLNAFPALRSDEVTNADTARRMINYIELIDAICGRLNGTGMVYERVGSGFRDQGFWGYLTWDNGKGHKSDAYLGLCEVERLGTEMTF